MILEFLFDAYPEKVSGNALAKAFPDNHQFKVELAYLIGKGFVKYVPIASEKKWKGRVEKFNASWMGVGKKAFTGTSYEIAVEGIDLLRSQLQSKTKTALTKKQKEKAVPLPIPKKVCLHKKTHLVEIQQGSVITVGGGLSVLKAERTQPKFLSFHECDDCGAVFYKEVQSMDARQAD